MKLIDKDAALAMIEELESQNTCGTDDFIESKRIAYKQVKDGILEMQEIVSMQEEPVSEDLEEAADNCYYHNHACARESFIEGAQWQKQQMMIDAINCEVEWYDGLYLNFTQETLDEVLSNKGIEAGNKVKVIIIKED